MSVLVTCQFDEDPFKTDDPIKTEGAIVVHNIIFQRSRAGNFKVNGWMGWKLSLSQILNHSWLSVGFMMIRSKMKSLSCPQDLLHCKGMYM